MIYGYINLSTVFGFNSFNCVSGSSAGLFTPSSISDGSSFVFLLKIDLDHLYVRWLKVNGIDVEFLISVILFCDLLICKT